MLLEVRPGIFVDPSVPVRWREWFRQGVEAGTPSLRLPISPLKRCVGSPMKCLAQPLVHFSGICCDHGAA